MKKYTTKELQKKCEHNYPLSCDTWLKYRCIGCVITKWRWNWLKIKKLQNK
jgi:hypothetical protein